MKYVAFLPLFFLTACASPKPVVVSMPRSVPGTVIASKDTESIRYPENLKAYAVGRYVDPNNPLVMHERHTVYRVETTAKWNLHPNAPVGVPKGPVTGIRDAAYRPSPVNAEIAAEVNRQKVATQAVIAQGQRLQQSLGQLSTALVVNQQIAEQNTVLKQEVSATAKRLKILEETLRERQKPPAPLPVKESDVW